MGLFTEGKADFRSFFGSFLSSVLICRLIFDLQVLGWSEGVVIFLKPGISICLRGRVKGIVSAFTIASTPTTATCSPLEILKVSTSAT